MVNQREFKISSVSSLNGFETEFKKEEMKHEKEAFFIAGSQSDDGGCACAGCRCQTAHCGRC